MMTQYFNDPFPFLPPQKMFCNIFREEGNSKIDQKGRSDTFIDHMIIYSRYQPPSCLSTKWAYPKFLKRLARLLCIK
jgi:hypothetical protein